MIKSGLRDLENEIEDMGKEEKQIEKPNEIIDVVEKIIEFKKPNQQGQGFKITTESNA